MQNTVGLGLRPCHFPEILENRPHVPWFEALTDNYLDDGGQPMTALLSIGERYPIALHGVGMSLGSTDPINVPYLRSVRRLADQVNALWISDHLCWTGCGPRHFHELLPLPFTREAMEHVACRIKQAQEILGRQLMIENVSAYLRFEAEEWPEWAFLSEVAERADCRILLDINNVYVSAYNFDFPASRFIAGVPRERVAEYHLAGFRDCGTHYLDDHGAAPSEGVLGLFKEALEIIGPRPTLIEWDTAIPTLDLLLREARHACSMIETVADAA